MRQRSTRLLLLFVLVLTTFSVFVAWPSDPDRYLPDFVPWPKAECVGNICIGKGISLFGEDRREMRLGLDLRGGTRLVLQADVANNPDVDLDEALETAVEVIERRVNAFGVAESITERIGSNRIQVQLPGISADEALEKIGRTAQLQFMELARDAAGNVIVENPDGTTRAVPLATVLADSNLVQQARFVPATVVGPDGTRQELDGRYLDRANIFVDRNLVGQPVLNFGLNSEGADFQHQLYASLNDRYGRLG